MQSLTGPEANWKNMVSKPVSCQCPCDLLPAFGGNIPPQPLGERFFKSFLQFFGRTHLKELLQVWGVIFTLVVLIQTLEELRDPLKYFVGESDIQNGQCIMHIILIEQTLVFRFTENAYLSGTACIAGNWTR